MPLTHDLPTILKRRRKEKGYSRASLALRIRERNPERPISSRMIEAAESGEKIPSLRTTDTLMDALGLEVVIREKDGE